MTFAQIKEEINELRLDEQQELAGYLLQIRRKNDPERKEKILNRLKEKKMAIGSKSNLSMIY